MLLSFSGSVVYNTIISRIDNTGKFTLEITVKYQHGLLWISILLCLHCAFAKFA
jgi:hypothetical protein